QGMLGANADFLKANGNRKAVIEGHTDERGSREYNIALGERRANAVRDVLQSYGVSASQIDTVSYGEERPAVEGRGEAVWAQNRRAVIEYGR
ncbi:MAG TPA: OmpA family protein, partial [Guyparkeria sp.]|nr:OmpA family protein [Guyparkeria sp.]